MKIKYKVVDKQNRILFPELDTYQLIDKYEQWCGIKCMSIGTIIDTWEHDGFIVERIIIK